MNFDVSSKKIEEAHTFYILKYVDGDVFFQDFKLFHCVKLQIKKFLKNGITNEKLLLNRVIIIYNTFENEYIIKKFRSLLNEDEIGVLKSILIFISLYRKEFELIESNRIFDDILKDTKTRYYLSDAERY
jgi:hypothetical protein